MPTIPVTPRRWLGAALALLFCLLPGGPARSQDAPVGRVDLVMDLRGFTGPVTGLTFSSDDTMLAAAGEREVRIWDLRSGHLLRVVRGQVGPEGYGDVLSVAFSKDNCELVVGIRGNSGRGAIRVYDIRNMSVMKDLVDDLPAPVAQLAFSRDGRHLVAVDIDGGIVAYDWRMRRVIGTRPAEPGAARGSVRFALDEPLVVKWGPAGASVLSVPGLETLAVDRRMPSVLTRWLGTGGKLEASVGAQAETFDLRLEHDQWLAGGSGETGGTRVYWVGLWSGSAESPVLTYGKHRSPVTAVALNWPGSLAASADSSGEVHVWDTATGAPRYVFRSVGGAVYRAALDVRTGRIGFTTQPAAADQWDRNHYGTIDETFDLVSRTIVSKAEGNFPGELLDRDGHLSLTYTDGRFGLRFAPARGGNADLALPEGLVPTVYTLLQSPRMGAEFPVIVGGQAGTLLGADPLKGQVRRQFVGHRSFVTSLSESADQRLLISSSTDRTIRFWNLNDSRQQPDAAEPLGSAEPLLNLLLVDDDDWILWTALGYYDASPGCGDLVGWRVDRGADQVAAYYPLHQFRSQLYRPDLVSYVLQQGSLQGAIAQLAGGGLAPAQPIDPGLPAAQPIGSSVAAVQPIDPGLPAAEALALVGSIVSPVPLTTDLRLPETMATLEPPRIRLLSPQDGMTTREGQVHLLAEVVSANQLPITEVKVLVNGRPASDKGVSVVAAEGTNQGQASFSRAVKLLPGENQIAVLARNEVAASTPVMIRVTYEAPEKVISARPNLHLLSIGISKYKDHELSLQFADRDAREFADAWQSQVGPVYQGIEKTLLVNEEATAERIQQAMRSLAEKVDQRDVAVIFISAHGVRDRRLEYYLASYEIDPENLEKTALHFSTITQLLETLPCKVLLFVDTCHAAGITGAKAIVRDPLYELTSDEYGAIVFSSSLSREISREDEKWQHGAFTKAILDTFADPAADLNSDGFLSLTEMEQSVCDRVGEMTEGEQHPVMKRPATIHNIPFYFLGEGSRPQGAEPTPAPKPA
ncbi:MAG: caspase family protein [Thermoguttaceae bacterium]